MVRIPAWLAEMAWRRPVGLAEREGRIWSPSDGDAEFGGGEGADLIWLDGLTLQQLRAGLRLNEAGVRLVVEGNGTVSFAGPGGLPARVGGVLPVGGATLRFGGVTRFAFLW